MKKIVICGSMKFFDTMKHCADALRSKGYDVIVPDDGIDVPSDRFIEYKRTVSRQHFDAIAAPDTDAVLVVNQEKNDMPNYIGANTFAEIAMAFYFEKKIYLLNDIYKPYAVELAA